MASIASYTKSNGRQPVVEWLEALKRINIKAYASMFSKIETLRSHGDLLLASNMLDSLGEPGFYELKYSQYRIGVHHDRGNDVFVLLHGWRKQRRRERAEVEQARRLRDEYLNERRLTLWLRD